MMMVFDKTSCICCLDERFVSTRLHKTQTRCLELFHLPTLMHNSLFINNMYSYTTILDMFRASTCPSSGGPIVFSQHLVTSLSVNGCTVHRLTDSVSPLSTGVLCSRLQRATLPYAVRILLVLLKMGMLMLETCRG
jgi:hypothetical protein